MITQLYQNLIGNALKFVDNSRPQINLTIESNKDRIIYGVKDNGIGINHKFADSIFEPFKRGGSEKKYEGSGIGLSICRNIVERHHGKIWVEPQSETGTHFKFTFGNFN